MNNDVIVFQHVYPGRGCEPWIDLTQARTKQWCTNHLMDYQLITREVNKYNPGLGHWESVHWLFDLMQEYPFVIYLDADCIVADLNADPRQAFVEGKIGAVWHNLSYHDPDWSHFNVGALYAWSTPETKEFVAEWLGRYPGVPDFPWWENGEFNKLGTERGIIHKLDNAWNAGHVSPAEHKIIWGLHGIPDRLESIRKAVAECELLCPSL